MKTIEKFEGKYHFLSNFHNAKIIYEGITYDNNEAAFQAQKDLSRKLEFTNIPPNQAKKLGRRVNLRKDWEQVKIPIMEEIVYAKFTQNAELLQKLLDTGDAKLVEGNWWNDKFWGICNGEGRNELGKILENLRELLK